MNKIEKAARIALAKRIRSMVPTPKEMEGLEDLVSAQEDACRLFADLSLKVADKLTKNI